MEQKERARSCALILAEHVYDELAVGNVADAELLKYWSEVRAEIHKI